MTRPIAPLAACILLAASAVSAGPPIDGDPPPTKVSQEERDELDKWGPLPCWHMFNVDFPTTQLKRVDGTVTDVGKDFIEVLPQDGKEKVKYLPHVLLATGRVVHWEYDSLCYLLEDVKVGDEVMLGTGESAKGKKDLVCYYISVRKRPGDVIPASRKPNSPRPYHLVQQARIDEKEKGIPLPPVYRKPVPLPGEIPLWLLQRAGKLPVAPPPGEKPPTDDKKDDKK